MQRLSSSEAIWPALKKTRHELFGAFAWPHYLKMCSIAVLGEGIVVCWRYWVRNNLTSNFHAPDLRLFWNSPWLAMGVWAAASALTLIGFAYYAIVRMRFVLFHSLVWRTRDFGSAWAAHGKSAFRMMVAFGFGWLIFLACLGIQAGVMAIGGLTVFTVRTGEGKLDPGVFLLMFLSAILLAIVVVVSTATVSIVLHDFILPHMALENLNFAKSWAAFRRIWSFERETFFWYVVLRILLSVLAWAIVAVVATALGYAIVWVISASASGYDILMDGLGKVGDHVRMAFDLLFALLGLSAGVLLSVALGGPLAVWTRNFAILFYAGRYRALGDAVSVPSAEQAA